MTINVLFTLRALPFGSDAEQKLCCWHLAFSISPLRNGKNYMSCMFNASFLLQPETCVLQQKLMALANERGRWRTFLLADGGEPWLKLMTPSRPWGKLSERFSSLCGPQIEGESSVSLKRGIWDADLRSDSDLIQAGSKSLVLLGFIFGLYCGPNSSIITFQTKFI